MAKIPFVFAFDGSKLQIRRARYDAPAVLADNGDVTNPRSAKLAKLIMRGFSNDSRAIIGEADWAHNVNNVDAAGGAGGLTFVAAGRYASPDLRNINGQKVEIGDVIEFVSSVARSFTPPISPGQYRAVDVNDATVTIQNINPAQYTLTDASEIGGAVCFRPNPDVAGGLEGLNKVPLVVDGTANQTRPSVPVGWPDAFIDGNPDTSVDGGHASYQGFWHNTKVANSVPGSPPSPAPQAGDTMISIVAAEMTFSSTRYTFDTSTATATFNFTLFGAKDCGNPSIDLHNNNQVYRKSTLAVANVRTWVASTEGRKTFYWKPTQPFSMAALRVYDDSGSRAKWHDFTAYVAGMNSQIKLKNGTIPESGSIINISQDAAKTFIPALTPGAYPVVKNDNVGPWKLGAPLALISPIGATLAWSLYVDTADYDEAFAGTIVIEVGTLYQLRINAPELVPSASYLISVSGQTDVTLSATSRDDNFSQLWRPAIADLFAPDGSRGNTGTITVTTALWTKTYDLRLQYTQKGVINLEVNGSYKTGGNFAIGFQPDRLRSFSELRWEVFNAATGASAISQSVVTGGGRTFNILMPAAGGYRLEATIAYTDTTRPIETFNIPFSVGA